MSIIDKWCYRIVSRKLAKMSRGMLSLSFDLKDGPSDQWQREIYGDLGNHDGVKAQITIKDLNVFRRMVLSPGVGGMEGYMFGEWTTPDINEVIRFFSLNIEATNQMGNPLSWLFNQIARVYHRFNDPSRQRGKKNIALHYDQSNALYEYFLDPTMMYSAPIYRPDTQTLEEASINKIRHVAERLEITADDRVAEIGTGWGGMSTYLAEHYGCHVTTITVSESQYHYTKQIVADKGLEDLVDVRLQDYRDLTGEFDKLVCIEVIESIGARNYRPFFEKFSELVKPDGKMLMQAITITDQRYQDSLSRINFIQRYVFPGGHLPSNTSILECFTKYTDFYMVGMEDISESYARALEQWRINFNDNLDKIIQLEDGRLNDPLFIRTWELYLAYCQGALEERIVHTSQFLMTKPLCRKVPVV